MTAPLWTEAEMTETLGGGPAASGVSIDSRTLRAGDLFVALKDARDGHDFVAAALAAGAAAALVERRPADIPADAPLIVVPDALKGLEALATAARARLAPTARVIGVTGSVGKTGVKEMLRACLAPSGPAHAAEKSYNNHWGVPLTLARMPRETAFAAIEMGMNHAGEIVPLSRLARPHVAIVTTVAPVHMAAFGSEEEIADAKAEIFAGLAPGGAAILNRDNRHFDRLAAAARAAGARVIGFGEGEGADARLTSARVLPTSTVVTGVLHGRRIAFKLAAPGRHLALNAMAALAAVEAAGGDLARATLALGRWTPPEGRGDRWRVALGDAGIDGWVDLIDESYNANPVSTRAALAVLGAAAPADGVGRIVRGRRIAFLGDMLELGPQEAALHAGLARAEEIAPIDTIHTCGPRMRALHDALPEEKRGRWFADSAEMAAAAGRALDAGDVAMVKGSLGAAMARVAAAIRRMGEARPIRGETDAL